MRRVFCWFVAAAKLNDLFALKRICLLACAIRNFNRREFAVISIRDSMTRRDSLSESRSRGADVKARTVIKRYRSLVSGNRKPN